MYYRLTPKMQQEFRQRLGKFHDLFDGIRCDSWGLEELVYRSIQSDNTVNHHATWAGATHDDKADIRVRVNGQVHQLQIKSGKILKDGSLKLSGHRLGRFKGDFTLMTDYLNNIEYELLSVPYRRDEDEKGRHHIYRIVYIDRLHFGQLNPDKWEQYGKAGKSWKQITEYNVLFTISSSQSWQVWWKIPNELLDMSEEFTIGH